MTEKKAKLERATDLYDKAFHDKAPPKIPSTRGVIKLMVALGGIVIPVICHLGGLLFGPPNEPDWQSGGLGDKLAFALVAHSGFPMFPLLGYCIASMWAYLRHNEKLESFIWRLGIYSGVIVALWYWFLFGVSINEMAENWAPGIAINILLIPISAIIAAVCGAILYLIHATITKPIAKTPYAYMLAVILVVSIFLVPNILGGLILGTLYFGVYFALLTYSYVAYKVFRDSSSSSKTFSLVQFLSVVTWLGAFMGLCRTSIDLSLKKYSTLPLEPPEGCYVATAAARGHKAFVGVQDDLCNAFPVSLQLCRLKAFELTVRSLCPALHCGLRKIYDCVGPLAASYICNRYLADAAYVLLKPAEWLAIAVLRIILGVGARDQIQQIYRNRKPNEVQATKALKMTHNERPRNERTRSEPFRR